jgi:hypothetical protein
MEPTSDPRKDVLSSAVLLVIGGGYLLYNLRYPLNTLADPGPGVFPLGVGLLLLVLGAVQLIRSRRLVVSHHATRPNAPLPPPAGAPERAPTGRAPWIMVGILVLYLLVVSWVGFLVSTSILVVICSKLMGTRGWIRPIALAVGILVSCHLLFAVWLHVPLPTGYFM